MWLSGSLRLSLYKSCVYSGHLFLISSASVRSLPLFVIRVRITVYLPVFQPHYYNSINNNNKNLLSISVLQDHISDITEDEVEATILSDYKCRRGDLSDFNQEHMAK